MALSAIKQMEELARNMPDVISLSQGIPSSPSDTVIRESVINAIRSNMVDKYSAVAGLPELRELISNKLKENGMIYRAEDEIIVTAGAMQALSATIFALTKPGDEIIILTPTYSYYRRIAELASLTIKNLVLQEHNKWKIDFDVLQKMITKRTKILVMCNPNNPTGSVLSKKEMIHIGMLAQTYGFTIISDDVYQSLYFGEGRLPSIAEDENLRKHIVRIVSLSKDYSLTGWRIGFLHADKSVVSKILEAHDLLINCAPVVSQYAGLVALKNSERITQESLRKFSEHRMLMGNYLETLRDHLDFQWPDGAYYFFPKIMGVTNSVKFCIDLLNNARLSTVPGSEFGEGGEGHIRLCFGKSKEEIIEGMDRLKNYLVYNTYTQINYETSHFGIRITEKKAVA